MIERGGSNVGLILGIIVVIGSVVGTFVYINKKKAHFGDDFDEGGERDDDFRNFEDC